MLLIMSMVLGLGFFIGMPIFLSIGLATLVYAADVGPQVLYIFIQRLFAATTGFSFIAVPLFMLAGKIMGITGITERLINFCNSLVGHWKGGLAQVNIVTSIFFAGISGSALADTAAIGSILIPAMESEGYERGFAGAVTAASATIGPIIPPSIVMVIYGSTFGVSIGALFASGFLPGLILGFSQMVLTYYISIKRNYPTTGDRLNIGNVLRQLFKAWSALVMPIIILGGIFSGIFTATEASAIAVLYAIIVGVVVYRKINLKSLYQSFREVALNVAGIMIILAVAQNFAWVITREKIPTMISKQLIGMTDNPVLVLLLITLLLLIAGMFIERTVNLFILTPILLPLMTNVLGLSLLHASMVLIFTLGVGHITPPFGGTLYVACMVGDIPMEEIIKFMVPYIIGMILVALFITFFPFIVTIIPQYLGYSI